jgi:hypothetical protein
VRLVGGIETLFESEIDPDLAYVDSFYFSVPVDRSLVVWRIRSPLSGEDDKTESEIAHFEKGDWTSVRRPLWGEASFHHTGWLEAGLVFPEPQMVVGVRLPDDREDVFRDGVTIDMVGVRRPIFYRHDYEVQPDGSLFVHRFFAPDESKPKRLLGRLVGHYRPNG